jgi:glycosyltransferase involved in cell wall biosynthesis
MARSKPQPVARVTCIVPARNEADRIAETVKHLYDIPGVERVMVVDDGSNDDTAEAAHAAGAVVLVRARNGGKGSALDTALAHLGSGAADGTAPRSERDGPGGSILLLIDGDVGVTAAAAAPLVEAVAAGGADVAIGRLPRPAAGGFGLVKRLAAWFIRRASGFEATEPLSGQRAIRVEALQACRPFARGFGVETGMTIDAARLGFRIVEVDVEMAHRESGRDLRGFLHRGRQGLDILIAGVIRLANLR